MSSALNFRFNLILKQSEHKIYNSTSKDELLCLFLLSGFQVDFILNKLI